MNLCEVGDIAVIENSKYGIIRCPVIYVNDYFITVRYKYDMTINIIGKKKFNSYINDMNKFIEIRRKENTNDRIRSKRIW